MIDAKSESVCNPGEASLQTRILFFMISRAVFVSLVTISLVAVSQTHAQPQSQADQQRREPPSLWQRTLQTLHLAPRNEGPIQAHAATAQPRAREAKNTPNLWQRTLQTLHLAPRQQSRSGTAGGAPASAPASSVRTVRVEDLVLKLELSPLPLKLSDARMLKVTLGVTNRSRGNYVHLEFPTTQRIEVLIRDEEGKTVTRWSEDQAFSNEPSMLTINPGERIEYNVSISTRDLRPGRSYTVEAYFPQYDKLGIRQSIVPR
jgi:Intracellular proteinase inhibitor